jgi:predicted DNA binding CopG/RHH family protein
VRVGRLHTFQSTEKVMQVRMTRELVAFLKTEASAKGLDR